MVSPNDPVPGPSELVEKVLGLLEEKSVPTEINDSIVRILEWWERGSFEITIGRGGFLLVGADPERGEVVVNLDKDRTGHITFSAPQARGFAANLIDKAVMLEAKADRKWILARDRQWPDMWRVEGIDQNEGDVSVVSFSGTDAERLANEFYLLKAAQVPA